MKRIRIAILFGIAVAAAPAAFAAPPPLTAAPESCRGVVDRVAAATGARLDHVSFSDEFAVLLHRDLEELAVSCPKGARPISIEGDLQSAYPQPGFFRTLAQAGAVLVEQPVPVVEAALRRCYDSAIRDDDETGVVQAGPLHVECQVYLREDGDMMIAVSRAPSLAAPARYPRAPAPTPGPRVGPVQ